MKSLTIADVDNLSDIEFSRKEMSNTSQRCKEMESFLSKFVEGINSMMLLESHTNQVYELAVKLIIEFRRLIGYMLDDKLILGSDILNNCTQFVTDVLAKQSTKYKRTKTARNNEFYVPPQERAIGTRWEVLRNKNSKLAVPQLIQSKFQYVSIIDTLKALFSNDKFSQTYFGYNTGKSFNDHDCVDGVFKNICCGSAYKKNQLFYTEPTALKLMIASDDFGICNPLGPKSTTNKVNAVYMKIRNMPEEYLSKDDNVYVIGISNSDDLKTKETDFNDIWRLIQREISVLEETGIDIGQGMKIRGSIACLTFDNLGASTALGFAEGTNTSYYCRICEVPKCECQTLCQEDKSKYRTKESYKENLKIVEESETVRFLETKGIKRPCVLNGLKFFHMIDCPFQDPLHDLNEGIQREFMKRFFEYLIDKKVMSEISLTRKIQNFDYGFLKKTASPSAILLGKKNLNQTGSQTICLLQNLPFIFFEYRNDKKLKSIWKCMLTLIEISQIAYSAELREEDVSRLEEMVTLHLNLYKKCFNTHLMPKHHFLLHYAYIIRTMGPIKFLSTIRFESKHQQMKKLMNNSRNFRNVTKTITEKHQYQLQFKTNTYTDNESSAKKKILSGGDAVLKHFDHLEVDRVYELGWFKINQYHYKNGLFIQHDGLLFEITRCLVANDEYYLQCDQFQIIEISQCTNSINIQKNHENLEKMIKYTDLKIKIVYEAKYISNKIHVIADDLSLNKLIH